MTLEDKFKKQLGDLAFTITVLQHQLEESQTKIQELENARQSESA